MKITFLVMNINLISIILHEYSEHKIIILLQLIMDQTGDGRMMSFSKLINFQYI